MKQRESKRRWYDNKKQVYLDRNRALYTENAERVLPEAMVLATIGRRDREVRSGLCQLPSDSYRETGGTFR